MTVIYVKRYRYATCGVAGLILLVVEHNGKIYRGTGPFYNAQPEDHMTSEKEDSLYINQIIRSTLQKWDGLCLIDDKGLTVPLFFNVPGYDKNLKYHSTRGDSFGTFLHLKQDLVINQDIPWQKGDL
jgi:hypothetical protein